MVGGYTSFENVRTGDVEVILVHRVGTEPMTHHNRIRRQ